jgi:hypothetical protein
MWGKAEKECVEGVEGGVKNIFGKRVDRKGKKGLW